MRIENLRKEIICKRPRVSATIICEDCDHKPFEMYFETEPEFERDIWPNPHSFLLASFVAAMHFGELRLRVDGKVCPMLCDGLNVAMRLLKLWHGEPRQIVEIEAESGFSPRPFNTRKRTASLLSGGVDSLALLYYNRSQLPLDHEYSIKDCFLIYGLDIGDPNKAPRHDVFEATKTSMQEITGDVQASLIPVYTNQRELISDWRVYEKDQYVSCLSSVAHAFSSRISRCVIALDNTVEFLMPHASHPRLNSNFSSSDLEIRSSMEKFSRLDKTRIIAERKIALENLRVCWMMNEIPEGQINCGKCPKCVRTMAELLVLDKLGEASTFPGNVLTKEMFETTRIELYVQREYYLELIQPMLEIGRHDLAHIIQKKLSEGVGSKKLTKQKLRRRFIDFDDHYLGGIFSRWINYLRH